MPTSTDPIDILTSADRRLHDRLDVNAKEIAELREQIAGLVTVIKANTTAVADVVAIYNSFQVLLKILSAIDVVAKWLITIGAACALLWATWKYGISSAIIEIQGKTPK